MSLHMRCGLDKDPDTKNDPLERGRKSRRRRQRFALLFFALTLAGLFWWRCGDLFLEPCEVASSRQQYDTLLTRYRGHHEEWDDRCRTFMQGLASAPQSTVQQIQEMPLEVVVSYLVNRLGFSKGEFSRVALYPLASTSHPRLILSKCERGRWPFRIITSLEMELRPENGEWVISFLRFRRGSRELPTGLAWIYLGPELQRLRTFECFSALLPNLAVEQDDQDNICLVW